MSKLLRHVVASFFERKKPNFKILIRGGGVAAGVVYL